MAANPEVFICTADTWVKVATSVQGGVLHRLSKQPAKYLQTYRLTGEAAPTDNTDAAEIFANDTYEEVSNDVFIDVYIQAVTGAGKVRIDL